MRPRIPSSVQAGDFRWYGVGDAPSPQLTMNANEWLIAEQANQNLRKFATSAGSEFAAKLFSRFTLAGVLHCEMTTREGSNQEWLVFATSANSTSQAVVFDDVARSRCGEFVFLPLSRLIELREIEPLLDEPSITAVQRFFVHFGGLRISMPHLGGTFFLPQPISCPPELLDAKRATSRWRGSVIFYIIDHCDYLILNEQGEVGYLPIEPDKPIRHHADSFESFLDQWLVELE